MKNKITLLSSFATDRLFDEKGSLIREQKGGPAFFASNVFNGLKIPYLTIKTPMITVDIMLKDGDEFGKIESLPVLKTDFANINTPYLLISPILNEFSLENIDKYKGRIFLDIQGFTREPGEFGKKKKWETEKEVGDAIFCLKVADYELPYINSEFAKKQKKKMLILSQGKKGSTVFAFGKSYFIKPLQIIKAKETLGAGDTFFANFLSEYIKTENPVESAKFATEETAKFLSSKSQHHNS